MVFGRHRLLLNNRRLGGGWLALLIGSLMCATLAHVQGVRSLASIQSSTGDHEVLAGTVGVSLNCTLPTGGQESQGTPQYSWFYKTLSGGWPTLTEIEATSEISFSQGRLLFRVVQLRDSRVYCCRITYGTGQPIRSTDFQMVVHANAPEPEISDITQIPHGVLALGSSVDFKCRPRHESYVDVQWYLNDHPVVIDNQAYSTAEGGLQLRIHSIATEHQGAVATCELRSMSGRRVAMSCTSPAAHCKPIRFQASAQQYSTTSAAPLTTTAPPTTPSTAPPTTPSTAPPTTPSTAPPTTPSTAPPTTPSTASPTTPSTAPPTTPSAAPPTTPSTAPPTTPSTAPPTTPTTTPPITPTTPPLTPANVLQPVASAATSTQASQAPSPRTSTAAITTPSVTSSSSGSTPSGSTTSLPPTASTGNTPQPASTGNTPQPASTASTAPTRLPSTLSAATAAPSAHPDTTGVGRAGNNRPVAQIHLTMIASCSTDLWTAVLASKLNRTIRKHPEHCQLLLAGRFSIHSLTKTDRDCSNGLEQSTQNTLWEVIVNLSLDSVSQTAERRTAAECMRRQVRVLQYRATVEQVCYTTQPKVCTPLTERTTASLGSPTARLPGEATVTTTATQQTDTDSRAAPATTSPTAAPTTPTLPAKRTKVVPSDPTTTTWGSADTSSRVVPSDTEPTVVVYPQTPGGGNRGDGVNDASAKGSLVDPSTTLIAIVCTGAAVVIICAVIITVSYVNGRKGRHRRSIPHPNPPQVVFLRSDSVDTTSEVPPSPTSTVSFPLSARSGSSSSRASGKSRGHRGSMSSANNATPQTQRRDTLTERHEDDVF